LFHDSAIHPANCSQSHITSNKFEKRLTYLPYVKMNVKPQGEHWKARNAYAEVKKEKSEYKFAVSVFKRQGVGSRFFKFIINLHSYSSPGLP